HALETDAKLSKFELNINVWIQLWTAISKCDVLCQVVDSRDPLSYLSKDLIEMSYESGKKHLILINKSDLLNQKQIKNWCEYFDSKNYLYIFWSNKNKNFNSITFFQKLNIAIPNLQQRIKVAFVGYPNVGKSTTINSLCGNRAVSESSTPGKTKIFQSIIISENLEVIDTPGLLIPKFYSSEAEMTLMGLFPIDCLTEPFEAVKIIASRIPLHYLYDYLNVSQDQYRIAVDNLIHDYGKKLKFFLENKKIDQNKVCKRILKMYVDAKILYCSPPPGINSKEFNGYEAISPKSISKVDMLMDLRKVKRTTNNSKSALANNFKGTKGIQNSFKR
ncbi:MAG: hypothetical protein MHPSP_001612, partial [Paramarteilia canceri]